MAVTNTGIVERVITGVHDANFVRPLGDEEVTNGDFSNGSTDWTLGTGWVISGGKAVATSATSSIFQVGLIVGVRYILTVEVSNYTSGTLFPRLGYANEGEGFASDGNFEFIGLCLGNGSVELRALGFDGSIDSVSAKEVLVSRESTATNTGAVERSITGVHDANFVRPLGDELVSNGGFDADTDWIKGTGVTIFGGMANAPSGSSGNIIRQSLITLDINKTYRWEFTISNYVNGDIKFASFNASANRGANGTYVAYSKPNGTGVNNIVLFGTFEGSIDNISVKEMLVNRESTATNTGIVERGVTGVNESVAFRQDTRTNLIPYSEEFSNAYWTKTGASVVSGFSSPSADTPLGAFKVVNSVGSSIHNIKIPTIAVQSGLTYTYSIFLKKGTKDIITIEDGNQVFGLASFNLTLKTSTNLNGINSKIEEFTNGWFKCSVSRLSASTGLKFTVYSGVSASGGDESGDFYIFGSQLEQKSYATSYIPTSGAAVTVDNNSTSVVNNTGIVERPITGVNESDEMFPDNGTSSVVNIAEVIIPLLNSLEARATTFENREATQEILINLQKC